MNQSDGEKSLSNERKKSFNRKRILINKNVPDSRSSVSGSGGLQSFFRWFRRDDVRIQKEVSEIQTKWQQVQPEASSSGVTKTSTGSIDREKGSFDTISQNQSTGTHSTSPSPGPVIDYNSLSKSSSCDSILSTATDGFAFVQPTCYEPIGTQTERVINPGPYTDSYKRRVAQCDRMREQDTKHELTLRKKYNLFSSLQATGVLNNKDVTLTRKQQSPQYTDLSLPTTTKEIPRNVHDNDKDELVGAATRKHRRTVSDSSKDKKAGAYVHVKGKRRAPQPPPSISSDNSNTLTKPASSGFYTNSKCGTLSPSSTLSRKKRPAPLPPMSSNSSFLNEAISNTSLLDDKEIRAIIEGTSIPKTPDPVMHNRTTPLPGISEERTPGGLTEEQKQQLIDNIRRVQAPPATVGSLSTSKSASTFMLTNNDVMKLEEIFTSTNGTRSPIHDYLYAEAIGGVSKPASPISPRPWYKRPISGVKHQESSLPFKKDIILKTIDKRKSRNKDSNDLPEVGYCRNSIIDPTHSHGSGPRFNLFSKIIEKSDDIKRREKDSEKRKSGFGIPSISELDREAAEIINKENASKAVDFPNENNIYFSAPEQLVKRSQSFAKRSECDTIDPTDQPKSAKALISKFEANSANISKVILNTSFIPSKDYFGADKQKISSTVTQEQITSNVSEQRDTDKTTDDKYILGLWSCPYCTLENPNWRIICEACERIKPYDKLSILEEPPLRPNYPLKKPISDIKTTYRQPSTDEWDKKTERVLKYFMPKTNPSGCTSTTGMLDSSKKSFGQAKMLASPKMGVKSLISRVSFEKQNGIKNDNGSTDIENSKNKFDDEKLKENRTETASVSSVDQSRSVFVDIDEVRSARIARFSTHLEEEVSNERSTTNFNVKQVQNMDEEALEMEKLKLREMIRTMNAKALADKYPVLQKPPVSNHQPKRDSPLVQRKNGFISSIPVCTKSPKSLRKSSPTAIQRNLPTTEHSPVVAEPYKLGAVKKTFLKKPDELKPKLKSNESKIINQEINNLLQPLKVAETIASLNDSTMVLNNDAKCPLVEAAVNLSDHQNEKVRQISNQLRSAQGVKNFRNTLKNNSTSLNRTSTIAINKLLRNLEMAIGEGAHDRAAKLAMDLAKMKVSLTVTRQSSNDSDTGSSSSLTDISITIFINDKNSQKGPLKVSVSTTMTIAQLKDKICRDFGIPVNVQRWMHADQPLSNEQKTLSDYGMCENDRVLFLYIVSEIAKHTKSSSEDILGIQVKDEDKSGSKLTVQPQFSQAESKILTVSDSDGECSDTQNEYQIDDGSSFGAMALPTIVEDRTSQQDIKNGWTCPLCTLINPPNRPGCGACSEARPTTYMLTSRNCMSSSTVALPKPISVQMRNVSKEQRNDLNRVSSNRKSSEVFNIFLDEKNSSESHKKTNQQSSTTELLTTRHIQIPEQKNIVMTAFTSPNITRNKYRGVDNFNPNSYNVGPTSTSKTDGAVITTASPIVRAVLLKNGANKPVKFGRNGLVIPDDDRDVTNHYMELVNLDAADLIANVDPFECPICFEYFKEYEGIVLRDCLHSFCKECLVNTINYSEEPEIRCPFMNDTYSCESVVQQREIKALVSKEMYEVHLAKSIRQAESKLNNTFHCKTPNCRGWCIYEDNVNQFKCPVCTIVNCLTCRAIHDGLDCKQYQDRMKSDCDTNIEAKRTKDMLQEMVEKGDALKCPTCQVVMMKKWGCDWLKCSMCKTEICWVTRGPRWGPGGKGDTSGGCRCGVDGKKCHVDCNYCH
ncbi:uncharacterized protein LOC131430941 [Malaya genurostris]|uniref:uncharacterized protein LOC131430941 n=1 Tax=Malaya genurostris TaxID=325434 RepID=UPI0026F3A3D1|nr:uncharacterized protein LOC131430941 [Malaya genurostris]XP_058452226.1 uncharacterized protein LOC131430941 [Malaya genurostris]XP_058452227.1 uncharacterized protein LOC131430941 [Malaya genurostris]XP_058452228.1 uncharacterized protein LOC131430941 [Malaya genurostris]